MGLQEQLVKEMKEAMKVKDTVALESLRAIKSALLLAQTEKGASGKLSEEAEMKILQKLVKQRKDSAAIYSEQGRDDLAEPELAQASIIERYLPEQLGVQEIEAIVDGIIQQTGAEGMKDMGKVMGAANKEVAGRADGKTVAGIVRAKLNS